MPNIFNALSGPELKKAILADLDRELELSGEFRNNITYPWVKYTAEVKILSYPKQAITDEPAIKVKVTAETIADSSQKDTTTLPPPDAPEIVLDLRIADVIDTPDKVRVESGQPIPTKAVAAGVLTDKPVTRVEQAAAPRIEQVKSNVKQSAPQKSAPKQAEGSPVGVPGIDPSV